MTSKHLSWDKGQSRNGQENKAGTGKQTRDRKINQSGSRHGELELQGQRRKSRDKGTRSEEDR